MAIVIPDITRPLPTDRLLPWVLRELGHVRADHVTIVNGTGSHRVNTPDELRAMVGPDVYARYRVVNHDAHDPARSLHAGVGYDGEPVSFNRRYVEADRRIVLGFIEPHFMAGFSGGYKGIFPAVADIAPIMRLPRRADDRGRAQHVGRHGRQPHPGVGSGTMARSCRWTSASTSR